MSRRTLTEARSVAEATPVADAPGRFLVQLITPGWGSSGFYGVPVLEAAAQAGVFPAGLHMYLDHPSASENLDRPERSVRDLAAVLNENATWDGDALVAEATVFGPYRDALTQMADSIGVSIRAVAETQHGEADGRRGVIVEELVEGVSADFVTHAGRGGRIVEVMESARPAHVIERAVAHGVTEATANEIRERLQQALLDSYGGEKSWVWVRDFDDTYVWYEHETPDDAGTFQHDYSVGADGAVDLSGSPVEVRSVTKYVPVTDPAGQSITTESQGETMGKINIEESEHQRLVGEAGRVQTLESERDTEKQRADAAEKERDELRESDRKTKNDTAVTKVIAESASAKDVDLDEFQTAGIAAKATFDADGKVDEAALKTAADTAVAQIAETRGVGSVRNFGSTKFTVSTDGGQPTSDQVNEARAAAFGRKGA